MTNSPAINADQKALTPSRVTLVRLAVWISLALAVLECVPFWVFDNFPSQDGPEHLYNAQVLTQYHEIPEYQSTYTLSFSIATGNLTSHLLLAALLRWFPPLVAQKILLTACMLGFFAAFYYVLSGISAQSVYLTPLAGVFAPNLFLHLGFWNFYLSGVLFLFALGLYLRHRDRMTVTAGLLFILLASATYVTHLLGWIGLYTVVGPLWVIDYVKEARRLRAGNYFGVLIRSLPLAIPLVFGVILFLNYLGQSQAHRPGVIKPNLGEKLLQCLIPPFVQSIVPLESTYALILGALLCGSIVIAFSIRPIKVQVLDVFLGLFLFFLVLTFVTPDRFGEGSLIHIRFQFFAYLFLAMWIAAQPWERNTRVLHLVALTLLSTWSLVARCIEYRAWDADLNAIASFRTHIKPGSQVLYVCTDCVPTDVEPLLHADGLLAPLPFINLSNYEAYTTHFPVRFRDGRKVSRIDGTITAQKLLQYEQERMVTIAFLILSKDTKGGDLRATIRTDGMFRPISCLQPHRQVCLFQRASNSL